jgi:hypothetical protein
MQQQQDPGLKGSGSFSFPPAAVTAEAATSAPSALETAAAAAAANKAPQEQQQVLVGSRAGSSSLDQQQQQQPPPVRRSRTLPRSFNYGYFGGPNSFSSAGSFSFRGAAGGSGGQPSKHTVDQLLRMMMAFTIMQGGGQGGAGEAQFKSDQLTVRLLVCHQICLWVRLVLVCHTMWISRCQCYVVCGLLEHNWLASQSCALSDLTRLAVALAATTATDCAVGADGAEGVEDEPLPTVSLDDDDGSSGVGLAAAAAVSAAMARAWASAASKEQRAVAAATAAAGGSGSSGAKGAEGGRSGATRAGFRLVATVTNKMGKCMVLCLSLWFLYGVWCMWVQSLSHKV